MELADDYLERPDQSSECERLAPTPTRCAGGPRLKRRKFPLRPCLAQAPEVLFRCFRRSPAARRGAMTGLQLIMAMTAAEIF